MTRYPDMPPQRMREEVRNGHNPQGYAKAEQTKHPNTIEQNSKASKEPQFNRTDLGNAEWLAYEYGRNLHYCWPWNKWLVWDEKRWSLDDVGAVEDRAKQTVRNMYRAAGNEAGAAIDTDLSRHAIRSESAQRIAAMITLARSEPGIPILPKDMDSDPWLLNCSNGTVDLRTSEKQDHNPDDKITKRAPVEYDPSAECPTFDAFLKRILPDEKVRGFVQRYLGSSLSGALMEEILAIFYGTGANGKTTLINVVMEAMGDYAMEAAPDLLMAKKDSHPTEIADLFGARFVASVESREGQYLAESRVKQLTGRDRLKARRMREDYWEFDPTHTLVLATNHKPMIRGTDHAIWRRPKLVPFNVTIPEEDQDPKLPEKLRQELPGILAWLVRGCSEWQRIGMSVPETVAVATEGYRTEMDLLATFIEDCCVVGEDVQAKFAQLYDAYKRWCESERETPLTSRAFGKQLTERGYLPDKGTGNAAIRLGIALRFDGPTPPDGPPDGPPEDQSKEVTQSYPKPNEDNSRNSCKSQENPDGSYRSYPDNALDASEGSRVGVKGDRGNLGNSSGETPANHQKTATELGNSELSEAERIARLVHEGMSESWARKEVLKKASKEDDFG